MVALAALTVALGRGTERAVAAASDGGSQGQADAVIHGRSALTCARNTIRGTVRGRTDLEGEARFEWDAALVYRQEPSAPPCGITGLYELLPGVLTIRHSGDLIGPRGKKRCPVDARASLPIPADTVMYVLGRSRRGQPDGPPFRYLAEVPGPAFIPRAVACPNGRVLRITLGPNGGGRGLLTWYLGTRRRATDGIGFRGTQRISGAVGPRMQVAPRAANHVLRGTATWSWTLFGAMSPSRRPVAIPRITPRAVVRGGRVTLNGRTSLPGAGGRRITAYRWRVQPATTCPDGVPDDPVAKTGSVVGFRVLCDVTGTLTVTDDRGRVSAPAPFTVVVRPRPGWVTARGRVQTFADLGALRAPCFACAVGVNRDADGGAIGVRLHRASVTDSFLAAKAYAVGQLRDPGGPFDGTWWVTEEDLRLNREEVVNQALAEGAPIDETNRAAVASGSNPDGWDIVSLRASVRAHEAAHTTAMHEALNGVDPAMQIEGLAGSDKAALEAAVEATLQLRDGDIFAASTHASVVPILRAQGWDRPGAVGLPSLGNPSVFATLTFPSYAELGADGE